MYRNKIVLLLWILITLVCSDISSFAGEITDIDIAAEEERMKVLERKIEEHRRKAQHIGQQEKSVLVDLSKLEQDTALLQQQNRVLLLKTQKLRTDINKLNKDIGETRAKIERMIAQLSLRLINMSRYGDAENLNVFFSSESIHEVINSIYLLEKLSAHDQKLIEELLDQERLLLEKSRRLTRNREELTFESAKLKTKQEEYNSAITATSRFLNEVRRQKSLQEQAAREAEAAQREIGRTISDLMRRKRERLADEKRQDIGAPRSSINYVYLASGSMLDWPLTGQINSPFGSRIHPIFRTRSNHSGIDISAPAGTHVLAAGPGEVLYAGWQRGFGQVIIIDHGRNISTVYAHLSNMFVKEGAAVSSGTRIGSVGNTGTTTGYHLHFEVRVGAEARDPLHYLKKR